MHGAFTLSAAIASAGHRLFLSRRAISLPPSCLPPPGRTASCSAGGDKIVMEARRRSGWTTVSGFLAVVAMSWESEECECREEGSEITMH